MTNFNLSIDQAVHNAEILDRPSVIYTTDDQGNLGAISKFNLLGRLFNYIKNLINGTGEHKVNQAVLATFETINQHAQENPNKPIWTYLKKDFTGKNLNIGFDKVAMRVLVDNSRFRGNDQSQIREVAYKVLLMATKQRKKAGIGFNRDL